MRRQLRLGGGRRAEDGRLDLRGDNLYSMDTIIYNQLRPQTTPGNSRSERAL